jgi:transcriptional regulator with XRE-family HTH domain
MVRVPLTSADRERGVRLGAALRDARGSRSIGEVASAAGISAETLRKIETGRIPTPAFFTVVALAAELGLPLTTLADRLTSSHVQVGSSGTWTSSPSPSSAHPTSSG